MTVLCLSLLLSKHLPRIVPMQYTSPNNKGDAFFQSAYGLLRRLSLAFRIHFKIPSASATQYKFRSFPVPYSIVSTNFFSNFFSETQWPAWPHGSCFPFEFASGKLRETSPPELESQVMGHEYLQNWQSAERTVKCVCIFRRLRGMIKWAKRKRNFDKSRCHFDGGGDWKWKACQMISLLMTT